MLNTFLSFLAAPAALLAFPWAAASFAAFVLGLLAFSIELFLSVAALFPLAALPAGDFFVDSDGSSFGTAGILLFAADAPLAPFVAVPLGLLFSACMCP